MPYRGVIGGRSRGSAADGRSSSDPAPVRTSASDWDLAASPGVIESAAEVLRDLGGGADSAQATVDFAAQLVSGEGSWEGQTADSYQGHRLRLTGDLGELADIASTAADALDGVASALRTGQALLDELRDGLSDIAATSSSTGIEFQPQDAAEALRVTEAVAAAAEVRAWVDGELALRTPELRAAQQAAAPLIQTWQPVGLLNLNAGQGHGRGLGNTAGADQSDIPRLARLIAEENIDIATLQEVYQRDLPALQAELQRITGVPWTIHYGEASSKVYVSSDSAPAGPGPRTPQIDLPIPFGDDGVSNTIRVNESFGNAVLVRGSGAVESSETTRNIKLDANGSQVYVPGDQVDTPEGEISGVPPTPTGTTTTTVPGEPAAPEPVIIDDGEGRSALEVEVRLAGP